MYFTVIGGTDTFDFAKTLREITGGGKTKTAGDFSKVEGINPVDYRKIHSRE